MTPLRMSILATALGLVAMTAAAQEEESLVPFDYETFDPAQYDIDRGKEVWERVGNCIECHGWDGANTGRNPRAPGPTPNLRESALDAGLIYEVVACGRPFTAMPYHLRNAYRDGQCYGFVAEDFEPGEMPELGNALRPDDITHLVAYMMTEVVGQDDATLADCEAFFGAGHRNCRTMAD